MKRKLALLIAAVMTVAMVPATAFASTKLNVVDEVKVGTDKTFTSRVEMKRDDKVVKAEDTKTFTAEDGINKDGKAVNGSDSVGKKYFDIEVTLTNGKFADDGEDDDDNTIYLMEQYGKAKYEDNTYVKDMVDNAYGILAIDVKSDTRAVISLNADVYNEKTCVLPLIVKAGNAGDVVAKFSSNVTVFGTKSEVIATAQEGKVTIENEGITTFVEDGDKIKEIKNITITELTPDVLKEGKIKLKLSGNWDFSKVDKDDENVKVSVDLLNENIVLTAKYIDTDEYDIELSKAVIDELQENNINSQITISGLNIKAAKKCKANDVATITVSSDNTGSKAFSNVKLEVAKMVKEAVTYSVEDKDLPVIWAGAYNDYENTLKVSVEENTGDILNTSRKATFTVPEGIEVAGVNFGGTTNDKFKCEIDENVVTIWNYSKNKTSESKKTDLDVKFILNAAPTFSGDVNVTLGGQFDDVSLKVATVKAPYTVTAKTSEVLIDYRYVPVNDIVITEAEEGILKDKDQIVLAVEKMDFEDAGKVEVTEGDIDVDVDIDDTLDDNDKNDNDPVYLYDAKNNAAYLTLTVNDESTEASTIVISGLELYLDRTLPVGGYALQNIGVADNTNKNHTPNTGKVDPAANILWENSSTRKEEYDPDNAAEKTGDAAKKLKYNAFFKYKAVTVNDSYVDVITSARDQDDSTTNKKIIITVGASTMAVGTETVNLDAPAYINSENYTMLPVRAISEAFGATVNWDAASRTVTVLSGQRIISMTIGSRTMYINGTPVAMNTTAAIVNDRTFIPVRDLANSLGISAINWTEASGTVTLN